MKTSILTLALCFSLSTIVFSQDSDYAQVAQTVSYYLNGGTDNDFETLKKAFHKDATMKFIRNGEYNEVNDPRASPRGIRKGKDLSVSRHPDSYRDGAFKSRLSSKLT